MTYGIRKRQQNPGWRSARSKLNRRVGTVDAVDKIEGQRRYGLSYDEAPQDSYLTQRATRLPRTDRARVGWTTCPVTGRSRLGMNRVRFRRGSMPR
jgi:hypothetical protein